MTALFHQRSASMSRPGHRQTITPMVSHTPETPAGTARRLRRLEAELRRLGQ